MRRQLNILPEPERDDRDVRAPPAEDMPRLTLRPVRRMGTPSLKTVERYARAHRPLVMHSTIHDCREMHEQLAVPIYCQQARRLRRDIWRSAPGMAERLTFDLRHHLVAQVVGRARFILYGASEWRNLSMPLLRPAPRHGAVDLDAPDLAALPRLARAHGWYVDTREGDLLLIPSLMWRHVRSLGESAAVDFSWVPLTMVPAVAALDLYKRLRGSNTRPSATTTAW